MRVRLDAEKLAGSRVASAGGRSAMDWKERQTAKKKDDTVEKARLAREARAQQRQQVKPALALGRAARGFLARRRGCLVYTSPSPRD